MRSEREEGIRVKRGKSHHKSCLQATKTAVNFKSPNRSGAEGGQCTGDRGEPAWSCKASLNKAAHTAPPPQLLLFLACENMTLITSQVLLISRGRGAAREGCLRNGHWSRGTEMCLQLRQEESGPDLYRGCAENISGSRKDMSRGCRSLLDVWGKSQHRHALRGLPFSYVREFREPFLVAIL